ncbi:DegV family protein [Clostridium thermarum]|uniref:DegV family protein n=1 Tax=Clostridium thermarum TaxID=1716543 RepID=UPI00111CA6F9|nr:DegV family protein [Clostridium thermarum]
MNTIIITDSTCDLTLEYVQENADMLDIIGMPVNIEGYEYFDDFGKTLSHDEFYSKLRLGIMPSTAQINTFRFSEIFKKHYQKGKSIIYIGFTSGMSGTFNNAVMAAEELIKEHPDADITVIDTLSASIGQGVLVVEAVDMLRNGKSKEEIVRWVEDNKLKSNHWFAVDDLNFLKKGGRISAATAVVGTALNIKPILTVDNSGKLVSYTNVRGRKKSIRFLAEKFHEHIRNCSVTTVIIGHGDCLEDAYMLKEYILEECMPKKLIVSQLSATIASHVGPNMIAVAFVGDDREVK